MENRVVAVVLAMAAVAFGGCTTIRMAVPADVEAESESYEAEGRSWGTGLLVDESFKLGPFSVEDVLRL